MRTGHDIEHLLLRHLQGLTTAEEDQRVAEWAAQTAENRVVLQRLETENMLKEDLGTLFQLVNTSEGEASLQRMRTTIQQAVHVGNRRNTRHTPGFTWRRYVAAAAILIIVAVGGHYYKTQLAPATEQDNQRLSNDVQAGGNRATLTLADGRTITLDEAQEGIVVADDNITYNDGATLAALSGEDGGRRAIALLELSTPRGGTYQITLPDSTKVWLNAASSLKYPSRFPEGERVVELEGEAYFDVSERWLSAGDQSARKKMPFLVKTNTQTVEVLGTQFNISAYADEPEVKTTLVEGSVRVAPSLHASERPNRPPILLKPGQQSAFQNGGLTISEVNVFAYTAWKEGMFYFKRTPLEEIMRQVARWYDVEVVYEGGIPKETFSGKVNRDVTLMELLEIFQVSSVNVKLEGNRLTVH